jgi:hypothetical protein
MAEHLCTHKVDIEDDCDPDAKETALTGEPAGKQEQPRTPDHTEEDQPKLKQPRRWNQEQSAVEGSPTQPSAEQPAVAVSRSEGSAEQPAVVESRPCTTPAEQPAVAEYGRWGGDVGIMAFLAK